MRYAIGIDLGATNIKTVAVTKEGELLTKLTDYTEDSGISWAERIREQIAKIETTQGNPVEWIGLAAPGLAAPDGRCISWMQGRLDSLQGLDWTTYLGARRMVPVLNDAHAALLGEAWKGAAAGYRDLVLLTLGTGVGGGILVDGRLLKGHIGRAGHLGHICLDPDGPPDVVGTPGSLEDAIGDCTIAERTRGRFTSTESLVEAHLAGDEESSTIWLRSVHRLACGIVSLINVLDPEVIILGGGITKAGAALLEPLDSFLDQMEWRPGGKRVPILPVALGEFAGAFGAAYHTLNVHQEVYL